MLLVLIALAVLFIGPGLLAALFGSGAPSSDTRGETVSVATLPQTTDLPVRRGARVLYAYDNAAGVGHVEGESFHGDGAWFVFRQQDGSLGYCPQGLALLVAVDAGTVLVEDGMNNVGRRCNVRGDGAALRSVRCWQIAAAVSGHRYLVRHLDHGVVKLVSYKDMTNCY